MPNLFVSYDLINQKNYPAVEKAIKECGTVSRVLLSVWYVKTAKTMEQARDHIAKALDKDDKLLVIEASNACGTRIDAVPWKVVTDNWNK